MSGHIHGATPWTRRALYDLQESHPDVLRTIEEAIPDGCWLVLLATGRPGPWRAAMWNRAGLVARTDDAHPTVTSALFAAIWAAKRVTVDAV
jgi:hypothetical protein